MALVRYGNPLNGTADADFILDDPTNAPNNTMRGLGGRDVIVADFDSFFYTYGTGFDAMTLTAFTQEWSTLENTMVNDATTLPHASIYVSIVDANAPWFGINVAEGARIRADVDFGIEGGADTVLTLYGADGVTVVTSAAVTNFDDIGSSSRDDAYLSISGLAAGFYYIAVTEADGSFELGDNFILNVTLEDQAVTNASPVPGNDTIRGDGGSDTLFGNAGNDTLDGGTGFDRMYGGTGDDTYIVDDARDVVIELSGQGDDHVMSSISYVLTAFETERLTLTGTAAINGTGTLFDDVITGNSATNQLFGNWGDDTLDGGGGDDVLIGGRGEDEYYVDSSNDQVIELSAAFGDNDHIFASATYTLTDHVEDLTLIGTGNINGTGNALDNTIYGNAGKNVLIGGRGNDTIYALDTRGDTLIGGLGNDTYYIGVGDSIVEDANAGFDVVYYYGPQAFTLGVGIEDVTLSSNAPTATGNGLNNRITSVSSLSNTLRGLGGDDILDGGEGGDIMEGGIGNDIYVVDQAGDVVTELANEGVDTVSTYISLALGANLENLRLAENYFGPGGTQPLNGTGNALSNTLIGNEAANVLVGLAGNDTINGGLGADTLTGGAGADKFVILYATQTDTITDFQVGIDQILLNTFDFETIPQVGTLAASAFRVGPAAADGDDRIIYHAASGRLYYDPDGAGGANQMQIATLGAGLALTASSITMFADDPLL